MRLRVLCELKKRILVDEISRGQKLSVMCGKASSRYNSSSMLHMS